MSETTFTPAPWVLELPTDYVDYGGPPIGHPDCREHFCIRKGTALRDANGEEPGTYNTGDLIMLLEDCVPENIVGRIRVDGYLIAAAPDLYAALRYFVEDPRFQVAVGGNPIVVDSMLAEARLALAKARGETP